MATPAIVPNGGEPTPEVTPNNDQVTLTQAKLDEIVRNAMGRAAAEVRKENTSLTQKIADLEKQLQDAKAASHDPSKSAAERRDAKDDAEALRQQITEMKNARGTLEEQMKGLQKQVDEQKKAADNARQEALNEKKNSLISSLSQKENFVDTKVVSALTSNNLKWDSENSKWTVVDDNGQPRLNSTYEPMTPAEFFAEFATKNPYLVRSDVRTGNNSSESSRSTLPNAQGRYTVEQIFGPKSNSRLANELGLKNPREYQRLKAEAKAKGIIA